MTDDVRAKTNALAKEAYARYQTLHEQAVERPDDPDLQVQVTEAGRQYQIAYARAQAQKRAAASGTTEEAEAATRAMGRVETTAPVPIEATFSEPSDSFEDYTKREQPQEPPKKRSKKSKTEKTKDVEVKLTAKTKDLQMKKSSSPDVSQKKPPVSRVDMEDRERAVIYRWQLRTRRLVANSIDAMFSLALATFLFFGVASSQSQGNEPPSAESLLAVIIGWMVVYSVLTTRRSKHRGQTIGRQITGIYVDGEAWKVAVREGIIKPLIFVFFAGLIAMNPLIGTIVTFVSMLALVFALRNPYDLLLQTTLHNK